MTCGPQGNASTCEVGTVLADTGPRVYQWVYAGSMVSVLVFAITKGLTFTKTTLMASSSLHNQVLHKVQPPSPPSPHPSPPPPPGLPTHPIPQPLAFTEHPQCARHRAGLWSRHAAHGAYSRIGEESSHT